MVMATKIKSDEAAPPDATGSSEHEFTSIGVGEFNDDEEGFIDVNVSNGDDYDEHSSSKLQENSNTDESSLQQPEMSPLMIAEADDSTALHDNINLSSSSPLPGKSPLRIITQMRSRHSKSGTIGDDSDDGNDDGVRDNYKSPTPRTCLRRKNSRNGNYQRIGGDDYPATPNSDMSQVSGRPATGMKCSRIRRICRESTTHVLRTTVSVMNFLARVLLWGSFLAMIVGVVWYSRELKINGTDPHLIAWFSAGAFVLLGFPIAMCGIIMHLKNYYQPNVQCYVVRILWMVPIYSIESWLCLRFHTLAIYIETLRDCYESYVLYSFFQFLIEVLGGEEALVLMLKDKSPTRGAHIWGLGCCLKPWAMGQPVSCRVSYTPDKTKRIGGMMAPSTPRSLGGDGSGSRQPLSPHRPVKRVQWTSPFFVKCKFGVLQYVLLKFVSSIFVMLLEMGDLYKEGDFTPRGGYLYICILTNLSQCWALYCLVFFYYALKNELSPIRPVGKFLSVKALVFFTWWQSLGITILFQMGMIPHYTSFDNGREWTSEAVAKGLQDWLICIEMFCAAIVHTFVFPHTDYLEPLGIAQRSHMTNGGTRRLGRKGRHGYRRGDDRSSSSRGSEDAESSGGFDVELGSGDLMSASTDSCSTIDESGKDTARVGAPNLGSPRQQRQGFVRALLDSTVPRDVLDESVGIFKGEFNVEKKTLLHHAATSDEYDLFSRSSKRHKAMIRTKQPAAKKLIYAER